MALIKKTQQPTVMFKAKISQEVYDEVEAYCKHFDVTLDDFADQGIQHVLSKCKEWKKAKVQTS